MNSLYEMIENEYVEYKFEESISLKFSMKKWLFVIFNQLHNCLKKTTRKPLNGDLMFFLTLLFMFFNAIVSFGIYIYCNFKGVSSTNIVLISQFFSLFIPIIMLNIMIHFNKNRKRAEERIRKTFSKIKSKRELLINYFEKDINFRNKVANKETILILLKEVFNDDYDKLVHFLKNKKNVITYNDIFSILKERQNIKLKILIFFDEKFSHKMVDKKIIQKLIDDNNGFENIKELLDDKRCITYKSL